MILFLSCNLQSKLADNERWCKFCFIRSFRHITTLFSHLIIWLDYFFKNCKRPTFALLAELFNGGFQVQS